MTLPINVDYPSVPASDTTVGMAIFEQKSP